MDYLPKGDPQRIPWLKNYTSKLLVHQKALGLSDAMVKAEDARAAALIAAIEKNEQKRAEYQSQVTATFTLKEEELGRVRSSVRLIKAQPAYSEAIGRDLGIVITGGGVLREQGRKPQLRVARATGVVRLKFAKEGFDGINLYRERTEGGWDFLGRNTRSPLEDRTPLSRPGQPEVRRYRAIFVSKDTEVGEPSDTLHVSFSG